MTNSNFNIKTSVLELHSNWDSFTSDSIFLQKSFLAALEESTPINMKNYYVEFYNDSDLIGICLLQHVDLRNINPFQKNEVNLKTKLSSWTLNTIASSILFVGNNLMSGQNAFRFSLEIDFALRFSLISEAVKTLETQLKSTNNKIKIIVWKDFSVVESQEIKRWISPEYYNFKIQPTMIFEFPASIKSESDYVNALSKKYRDQYKRARKKATEIEKRQLVFAEITELQDRLLQLYSTTVSNASFNTFHLPLNHFATMKKILGTDFQVYAYFVGEKLIGFNTIIKNEKTLEPYFLGYDAAEQKNRLLYLNMLYDIIGYAAAKDFSRIAFGRTALEIKSSVGAQAVDLYGFIKHSNPIINLFIAKIFARLEPNVLWRVRNPFKVGEWEQQV